MVMLGATVTTKGPEVAPEGMVRVMEVALQELIVTGAPLRFTALPPCEAPNPEPEITTCVPTGPVVGEMPEIFGAGAATVEIETLSKVAVANLVLSSLHTARPTNTFCAMGIV